MRIVYLDTSRQGLAWFRQYYADRPDLNKAAAIETMRRIRMTIRDFPFAGQALDGVDNVFEMKVPKTAFSILYTIHKESVFIIDIRDQRGYRSAHAIGAFADELERRFGIS